MRNLAGGIIGTGLLAVPILASSAAYAVAETFRFREGLYRKWASPRLLWGPCSCHRGRRCPQRARHQSDARLVLYGGAERTGCAAVARADYANREFARDHGR